MSALKVGLTGGLAAGKSTVARWLRDAGFEVFDADQLVAELYRPGAAGAVAVERLFGPSFLDRHGAVDRQRLAGRIFADPAARRRLEVAIHPLVRRRFETLTGDRSGVVVLEATLLVEAGFATGFDRLVTVEADPEIRIRRAVDRGLAEREARQRDRAQSEERVRVAGAHWVIRNNGSRADLRGQVDKLIEELRRLTEDAR